MGLVRMLMCVLLYPTCLIESTCCCVAQRLFPISSNMECYLVILCFGPKQSTIRWAHLRCHHASAIRRMSRGERKREAFMIGAELRFTTSFLLATQLLCLSASSQTSGDINTSDGIRIHYVSNGET